MLGKDINRELANKVKMSINIIYRYSKLFEIVIITKKMFGEELSVEYRSWWGKVSDQQLQEYGVTR